eukprot:SM000101S09277  [mRNA]  locus=s101:318117:321397:+ [translate_table: standard]
MAVAAPGQLNLEEPPSWGSRSVDHFEKLEQIGEGTYGQVYMAKEKATGDIVALKKVRMDNEKEGFPITAIREIKILKKLKHENVIDLKEIVTSKATDSNKYKGSIYMVFEYMDHDLTGLADRPGMRFSVPQIKCYMKQLLTGLHYCHVNLVLHRDIKGSNLLIDNKGILKLADFGLARPFSSENNGPLTNRVITLWYRPPELLMGENKYGPAVDMWSVGCIFAELLHTKPILPGKNEVEQLNLTFQLCGSPDESVWPGVSKLPWYHQFKPERPYKRRIREVFRGFDRHALDLVERMLTLDPAQRITAKDALDAEYFWTDPVPCAPSSLPTYEASHEYQTKKKRQQQRQQAEEAAKKQRAGGGGAGGMPQSHGRLPAVQSQGGQHRGGQPQHSSSQPGGGGGYYTGSGRPPPGGGYPQGGSRAGAGQGGSADYPPGRGTSSSYYGSYGAYTAQVAPYGSRVPNTAMPYQQGMQPMAYGARPLSGQQLPGYIDMDGAHADNARSGGYGQPPAGGNYRSQSHQPRQ